MVLPREREAESANGLTAEEALSVVGDWGAGYWLLGNRVL